MNQKIIMINQELEGQKSFQKMPNIFFFDPQLENGTKVHKQRRLAFARGHRKEKIGQMLSGVMSKSSASTQTLTIKMILYGHFQVIKFLVMRSNVMVHRPPSGQQYATAGNFPCIFIEELSTAKNILTSLKNLFFQKQSHFSEILSGSSSKITLHPMIQQ